MPWVSVDCPMSFWQKVSSKGGGWVLVQQASELWWNFSIVGFGFSMLASTTVVLCLWRPLCDPSVCAICSVAAFGFVFCLGERDLSPWHFGPFWIVTWSGGNAGTFGKVSARARGRRLTEEIMPA